MRISGVAGIRSLKPRLWLDRLSVLVRSSAVNCHYVAKGPDGAVLLVGRDIKALLFVHREAQNEERPSQVTLLVLKIFIGRQHLAQRPARRVQPVNIAVPAEHINHLSQPIAGHSHSVIWELCHFPQGETFRRSRQGGKGAVLFQNSESGELRLSPHCFYFFKRDGLIRVSPTVARISEHIGHLWIVQYEYGHESIIFFCVHNYLSGESFAQNPDTPLPICHQEIG